MFLYHFYIGFVRLNTQGDFQLPQSDLAYKGLKRNANASVNELFCCLFYNRTLLIYSILTDWFAMYAVTL